MKLLNISALSSNSGKTVTTSIILRLFRKSGYDITGFKGGGDFIDSQLLSIASESPKRNIDLFLMGEKGVNRRIAISKEEYGIVEGMMGYFDGIGITKRPLHMK